ncbi:MAG: YceI family protein [Ilumatobacteraceae bacterium]|jgi:polyisoprenoid-binding protein YceI
MSSLVRKIVAGVIVIALGVVGGPWVYINLIKDDAPDALTLEASSTTVAVATDITEAPSTSDVEGEWVATSESVVGYRVKEILFGQSTEGVGRTNAVTGSLVIADSTVTSATFSVDMGTLTSDSDRRDRQVSGRILDVASFPTATFELTEPIVLTPAALDGAELSVTSAGTLTLRGVTKQVSIPLVAKLVDGKVSVNGSLEIVFAEWSIPDPSISAIVVEDRGLLEFLIVFSR